MQRVGVSFPSRNVDLHELTSHAALADHAGYDSLWIPESWGHEVFTVLQRIADATSRIRLGPGIANVYSRTPTLLGMTAATLNELSGGRVFLGLGTSGRAVIENFHGVKYEHPLDRVRECVSIIRQVTSGATLDHRGPTFNLRRFKLACKLSHGAVPVYLAALGPRMLRLAGEIADGALLLLHPRSYLPEALRFIEEGLTASGRRWEDFDVAYMTPFAVSEDAATARSEVKKHVAFYVGAMGDYYYRLLQRTKFSREADEIKTAWKRGDRDAMTAGVSDALTDEVGVFGTVEDCRKAIGEFHTARVNTVVLDISPMRTLGAAATAKGLESLGPAAET